MRKPLAKQPNIDAGCEVRILLCGWKLMFKAFEAVRVCCLRSRSFFHIAKMLESLKTQLDKMVSLRV